MCVLLPGRRALPSTSAILLGQRGETCAACGHTSRGPALAPARVSRAGTAVGAGPARVRSEPAEWAGTLAPRPPDPARRAPPVRAADRPTYRVIRFAARLIHCRSRSWSVQPWDRRWAIHALDGGRRDLEIGRNRPRSGKGSEGLAGRMASLA